MAKKVAEEPESIDLRSDGWARFEAAVDIATHRKAPSKGTQRKKKAVRKTRKRATAS